MTGFRVVELYAWVQVDDDGNEGVIAFESDGLTMPAVGADMARMRALRPIAEMQARSLGRKVELRHWTDGYHVVDVVEVTSLWEPQGGR